MKAPDRYCSPQAAAAAAAKSDAKIRIWILERKTFLFACDLEFEKERFQFQIRILKIDLFKQTSQERRDSECASDSVAVLNFDL